MRIAWFANIDFQEGNAANSRIRALADGLKANGNQVFLFLLSSTIFNSNKINKKNKGFFHGIYFNYLSGSVFRSPFIVVRFLSYLKSIICSSYLLVKKRKHFDIIFIYSPRIIFFGHIYVLAKLLKIPLILEKTELEAIVKTNKFIPLLVRLTDRLDAYIFDYFCSHLIVISENLKAYYQDYMHVSKITLIPIVVDLKRFASVKPSQAPVYTIGYLGSFGEKDGIHGLIESFKEATKQMPELKLKLIGYNSHIRETKLELRKFILNGQVEHSGQIAYDQVPNWLAKCDLLVMNRTNHEYSHYGFPTKLGEYLATGIPTICTKVSDIEKYLEHSKNSYLIEADNHQELTKAIIERYQNYSDFNAMGLKGKQIAKSQFDYHKYIPVLQSVFEDAVSKKA